MNCFANVSGSFLYSYFLIKRIYELILCSFYSNSFRRTGRNHLHYHLYNCVFTLEETKVTCNEFLKQYYLLSLLDSTDWRHFLAGLYLRAGFINILEDESCRAFIVFCFLFVCFLLCFCFCFFFV